jgi:serine/alanine adding enzyme
VGGDSCDRGLRVRFQLFSQARTDGLNSQLQIEIIDFSQITATALPRSVGVGAWDARASQAMRQLSSGIEERSCEPFPRLNGHQPAWFGAVATGFNQRAYLLRCFRDDATTGLLPLNLVAGPLFGRFLVSLPYLNTGGVWASDESSAGLLVDSACDMADRFNVRYLELRHEQAVDHPRLNHQRTDKFHMRLLLPASEAELMASFKSKLRSQIKKSEQYGASIEFGGELLLDDFYGVFARNMRDLGTPVFSRILFASILQQFGGDAEIAVVRQSGQAIAAALLVHVDGLSEVPSASCLREFNHTSANMFLYWNLLRRAIQRGSCVFDFGRSSEGSGTYKFKAQWGAQPHPAIWQYYVRHGSPEQMRPEAGGKQRLVKIWQRLPVPLTRLIGPPIVRGIP